MLSFVEVSQSEKSSLGFAIDRFIMKLFQTSSTEIICLCQSPLNFELPSIRWEKRVAKLEQKLLNSQNPFCKTVDLSSFVVDDLSDFSKLERLLNVSIAKQANCTSLLCILFIPYFSLFLFSFLFIVYFVCIFCF